MASKGFPLFDSIDFHVNKLEPENDTSEFKSYVVLPFLCEDEDFISLWGPTQAAASVTTTTTINSTNNVHTNNNTANDTNSILIPSSTTTTATNNRTNNENTNSNTVSDSKKLLAPTGTSTTTTNNNTNIVNANNSENNTSSKLIPSSIDEERNESEKGTALIVGNSMLAGLREAKLFRSKRIKVRYVPSGNRCQRQSI